MSKRLLICAVALLIVTCMSVAADKGKEGSWTGWVTDSMCGANPEKAKNADCVTKCVKNMGAKYALYDPGDKKVYILDPQDKAAAHAGHHVTVKGTVDGDTIKVSSIEMAKESKSEKPKS